MALTRVAPAGIGSTPGTGYVIGDSFLHSRGLNAIDANYTGIVTAQSIRVVGNLQVDGTTTTLDTVVTEVDKLEVAANNNTVGVAITQSGSGANTIFTGGYVRVNTDANSPLELNVTDSGPVYSSLRRSGTRVGYYGFGSWGNSFDIVNEVANGQVNISTPGVFKVTTNGTEKLNIDSGGNIGVAETSPASYSAGTGIPTLVLKGNNINYSDRSGAVTFISKDGTTGKTYMYHDTDFYIQSTTATNMLFYTNNQERMRIDSSGKLLVGPDTRNDLAGLTANVQSESGSNNGGLIAWCNADSNFGGYLALGKSRGSAIGSVISVQNNDNLGTIYFFGADGTDRSSWGAQIEAEVDGNPAENNMPGRLIFLTTPSGASSPTERMRIDSSGKINIGGISSDDDINVVGSGVGARLALIRDSTGNASDGDLLGAISFQSYPTGQSHVSAETAIKSYAETGQSGSAAPSDLRFFTKPNNVGPGGSAEERLRIQSNGILRLSTPGDIFDGTFFASQTINNTGSNTHSRIRFDRSNVAKFGLTLRSDDKFCISNLFKDGAVSADDSAFVMTNASYIGVGTDDPDAKLHVRSTGITAGAPSEGWPDWNADNDDNAKVVALLETGGNGNVNTAGHGASVVLKLCQYYDSRAVISPAAGGAFGPSDQGTGHGKDLLVKGGRSDNSNGKNGGRLFLTGGSGFYGGSFGNLIGDVILQPQGGYIGLNGQTNPEYPFDLIDGNNRAYFTQGNDSTMSLVMYDNSSHHVSIQAYGGQLRLNTMPTANGNLESCMRFNTDGDAIIGGGFNEDPTSNTRLVVKDTNSIVRIESPGSAGGEYTQIEFKTGATSAWIWKNPTSNSNYGGSDSLNIYQTQNAPISFFTNGNNERLRITGNGQFLVGGGSSINYLKNEYRGSVSVTGTNNETFAFEFQGLSYAGGGHLFFGGTSGNVVVNVSAEILVNHSQDVTIKSMSGAYTQARIRVKTDNNARAAVYIGRSGGYPSGTTILNWRFIPYGGTYAYTTESTNNGTDETHTTQSGSFRITAAGGGAGNVNASGSKNFMIDHPLESLRETTRLAHAAVEGPECNTIYRGKVDLVDGTATVNIDTNSRMTEGTFVALNQNVQCFTTNETGWTAIKGSVSGNLLTITAQDNTCTDTISWMVVGERHDQDIIDNRATDSEGRFIPEIADEYDSSQFASYTNPVEPESEPDNTEERDPTV